MSSPAPANFTLSFDGVYGSLVMLVGDSIIDLSEVHIARQPSGRFDCEVACAGGAPVRLVAAVSKEGRQALERANGKLSSVEGFVEVAAQPVGEPKQSLRDDVAACFGCEAPDGHGVNAGAG
jgi:hypothetical protein